MESINITAAITQPWECHPFPLRNYPNKLGTLVVLVSQRSYHKHTLLIPNKMAWKKSLV